MTQTKTPTLDRVAGPADLRGMSDAELALLSDELRGEVIADIELHNKKVDLSALPPNLYLLTLSTPHGSRTMRLVKTE